MVINELSGWFKQPSGESQQMGWFPGKIHKNDIGELFYAILSNFVFAQFLSF